MQEVRLVLAVTPPFLADLIRAVLAARLAAAGYALAVLDERDASAEAPQGPPVPAPDVVIIGPLSAGAPASAHSNAPLSRLLRLSPTLHYILGPGDRRPALLTPDELAGCVLEIVREIEREI